jgi:hypothetical protein
MSTRLLRPNAQWRMPLGSTRPARAAAAYRLGSVPIVDTGMRGLLKWMRQEYPPAIYQQIAAGIQQAIPQAFSGYMLGGWRDTAKLSGFADSSGGATVDTADAANSTPISPSWVDTISQLVGTATGAYLDVEQQKNQNAVLNAQLTAIQNGRAPLPISLGASGISFTAAGQTSIGTVLLWGGLIFVGLKLAKVIK